MNDDKVSMGLRQVNVKDAWTKNMGKQGRNGKNHMLRVGCCLES